MTLGEVLHYAEQFRAERARAFFDLMAHVQLAEPQTIVDLGCGDGAFTASLAQRWGGAHVYGVDSSLEMLTVAGRLSSERLSFEHGDLMTWQPPCRPELVVSSAALQWVPGHARVIRTLGEVVATDGVLAFQVPQEIDAARALQEMLRAPLWRSSLASQPAHTGYVLKTAEYVAILSSSGFEVNAWDTTYFHVLQGEDPVLDWMRATLLRSVLPQLPSPAHADFLSDYGRELERLYPRRSFGTVLPIARCFVVGSKRA
ncbi:MAG TPA: methyltransferase domain-containing protein [Polyangiaceae bacterium]